MNQLCMFVSLKPLSVNEAIVINRGKIQCTYKANKFKKDIADKLNYYDVEIEHFICNAERDSTFECRYIFWIPEKKMITQTGHISKFSLDVDNCVKYTQDALFKALNIRNGEIDDCQVLKVLSEKRISPKNEWGITICVSYKTYEPHKIDQIL